MKKIVYHTKRTRLEMSLIWIFAIISWTCAIGAMYLWVGKPGALVLGFVLAELQVWSVMKQSNERIDAEATETEVPPE